MVRIAVFGNSGSGKSTYARQAAEALGLAHLDLDTLAWDAAAPNPTRLPLETSARRIRQFMARYPAWVIEGCYGDLLQVALSRATKAVFLNPGLAVCQANARARPWEPHKYPTPEAQAENLAMLLGWIGQYESRQDEFSLAAHRRLYQAFSGEKVEYTSNDWLGEPNA